MTPILPSPSVAPTSARECADFSFSNVADATCSRLRGATARGPDAHSDPVVFNSLLQNYCGRRSWGNEQPAASEYAGQAPQKFNQEVAS